jgi:hypothetical protein
MKRIVRLTEKDLTRLIKRVLSEGDPGDGKTDSFPEYEYRDDIYVDSEIPGKESDDDMTQQVAEDWYRRRINRRRLNEDDTADVVKKIKACYTNSGKTFPSSCEKGTHTDCKEKIKKTATSFFVGNKNAQNDPKVEKFWGCINKADSTILKGMG